jgi:hypothetical protein
LFNGTLKNFTQNGDWVKLELKDASGKLIDTAYVKPVANGTGWDWSWDRTAKEKMVDGQYSLSAVVVDGADNVVGSGNSRVSDVQAITIDTDKDNNFGPNKEEDPNKSNTVDIVAVSQDTGYSSTDFITKDRTHVYTGKLSAFTNNGASVELTLKDASGKVLATEHVLPKQVSGVWTWSWDQTANALPDGEYSLQASLVDKAGNPIQVDTQLISVDNSAGENGGKVDPNASLKMLPVTFTEDTGFSQTDYLTNDSSLTFKGGFDKNFVNNGDRVLVKVFGADGQVVSQQYVLPTDKNWEFINFTELGRINETVTYTVKSELVDAAGNTLKATDQSFVIDRELAEIIEPKRGTGAGSKFEIFEFSATERGQFTLGEGANSFKGTFTGGIFDFTNLNESSWKKVFNAGEFKLTFVDFSGNVSSVVNTNSWDFTNATKTPFSNLSPIVTPGFNGDQLVGSVGKFTLGPNDPKELDMATLHDGIAKLGDVVAINHVDLSQGDHTLKITMGDVLELGVKNSFSTVEAHIGKLQMRIDGDSGDKVTLDNLVGTTDHVWDVNQSAVTLDGQNYSAFVNAELGLSLFVNQNILPININLV